MKLSYRYSYKDRQKRHNIIMFIVVAIIFIAASVGVLYLQSLDFSKGALVTTENRMRLEPLKLQHFSMVKVNTNPNATNPEGIDIIRGDNQFDETTYQLYDGAVTNDYFDDALFIGDSRTEGFVLYTGLNNIHAYCSKGLSVASVFEDKIVTLEGHSEKLTVIEALQEEQYAKIYIMFGVNELGWAVDTAFTDKYGELLDQITELQPDAIIYVQNILPISAERSATDAIYNNENVNRFNQLIEEMCKNRKNVIYLDVASGIADEEGNLPADASTDGVHCNKEYCILWLNYLKANTYMKNQE